jgi:hypothetical protein
MPVIFMEYGLHLIPRKMRAAIQAQIDTLIDPHLVLIGFGLCGNGLVGLKSRQHTLIIPRVDDCVSLFLGSRQAYLHEFSAEPATYYLTPGWLECHGEPLSEYHKCSEKYGPEKARVITDALYGNYRNLCLVAYTPEDLQRYRPQAVLVAEFCRERWGWRYRERLGSDALVRRWLAFGCSETRATAGQNTSDFVIVEPGDEVRQEQFMPVRTNPQEEATTSCTIFTIK